MTSGTVGIDLAVRGDPVARMFDDARPGGRPMRLRHDPASLDAFVARVTAGLGDGDIVQAAMEPTGMSRFPVVHRHADARVSVASVKGGRVEALRRRRSEHAETDLADAHVLAAIPRFGGPRLDPVHVPAPASRALQRLTKRPGRLEDDAADARRRLIDLIRRASPSLARALPDLRTRPSPALPQRWPDPDVMPAARKSPAARGGFRNAGGNPHGGPFVEALVGGLRQAARDDRALHRGHVDFAELRGEVEVDVTPAQMKALADLERRTEALHVAPQPDDVLRTIPGVGQHLAPVPLGVPHTADRFRSERRMRGFRGLFPARAGSGGGERPGQAIAQGGDDRTKPALTLAADTARKIDPDPAEVRRRLMTTKGHHHKQAL